MSWKKPRFRVAIIFLLLSLGLYFFKFAQMVTFDADQEFFAKQYVEIIKNHKLTLLGIETSIGGLFVGPLYTYGASIMYWIFKGDPAGLSIVTLFILSFQASLTYWLFCKLKGAYAGIIAGTLLIFSSAIWRKAFAPSPINFIYLEGLLFFYFLLRLKDTKKYLVCLAFILGLTFHIYYSYCILQLLQKKNVAKSV